MSSEAQDKMSDSVSASSPRNQNETASESRASNNQREMSEYKETNIVAIDTNALLQWQKSVAENLGKTYVTLEDFPEISCDVNMTVQDLKTTHAMTCGLLTTFGGSLKHLVETMIPLVLEGLECMDAELVGEAFDQVIENSESMTNETQAVLKRYGEIQTKLGSQKISISSKNNLACKGNEERELKKACEQSIIDQANADKKQLETEMSIIEDEMKTLKDEGDKIFKQTGGTYVSAVPKQSVADRNESRRVESESIFTVIFKLLEEVFRMLKATPKSADVDEKLQRLDDFESKARNARKKQSEIQDKIDEKQKEIDTRMQNMRKLGGSVKFGNPDGIVEATKEIENVKQSLAHMFSFWESMSSQIKHLKLKLCTTEQIERLMKDETKADQIRKRFKGYDEQLEQAKTENKSVIASCPEKIWNFQQKQAHMLELTYTHVADHPNVAEKIRMAAHDARSNHLTSCGVMKSVQIAADHMHDIMIPIVLEAIETKDSELIAETIAMSLEVITEVQQKTAALKDSYAALSKGLEKVKEDLKRDQIEMAKENKRLDQEIIEQQKQNDQHKRNMEEIEKKKADMLEEIKRSKEKREQLLDKTEKDGKDEVGKQLNVGILGAVMGGICLAAAATVPVLAAAGVGITVGTAYISSKGIRTANRETIDQMVNQRSAAEESARKYNQDLREKDRDKDEKEIASFKNQRKINELQMEKTLLCDTTSLNHALECSAGLNGQYEFLTLFWEDMIAAFGQLNKVTKTGSLFRMLKTDLHISRLTQICKDASAKWMILSKTSGMIEQAIRNDVESNFAFMSKNYNSMKPEEKKNRIDEIEKKLKIIKMD